MLNVNRISKKTNRTVRPNGLSTQDRVSFAARCGGTARPIIQVVKARPNC